MGRGIFAITGQPAVVGSLNLVQALSREELGDRLDLWMHPIVLGAGTRCSRYAGQLPALLRAQYRRRGSPESVTAVWAISSAGWSTATELITTGEP